MPTQLWYVPLTGPRGPTGPPGPRGADGTYGTPVERAQIVAAAVAAVLAIPLVWQLHVALKNAGNFDTVNNSISSNPGEKVFELWTSGGARLSSGDSLYTAVAAAIGVPAADAAYAAAALITS